MTIPPEMWDLLKIGIGAYFVFCLNKTDRNQRELFNRLRHLELGCAKNHAKIPKEASDDDNP